MSARLIIGGKDQVPHARATPAGRPDTSTEEQVAANSKMLWLVLRETIRHANGGPVAPERRDDVVGLLWRGNPRDVAVSLWDGMDESDITAEVMAELYDHLRLTRHLIRVDEGPRGRQWWVADQWDDTRVPTPEAPYDPRTHARTQEDVALPGEPAAAVVLPPDPIALLQGILDRNAELEAENLRLKAIASVSSDTTQLAEENLALREREKGNLAAIRKLRGQVTAYETILKTRADDDIS